MAVFKCKMCGGDLQIHESGKTAQCLFCGSVQTLPKLDDDRRTNLYGRADRFRRNNEFDKAIALFEQLAGEDPEDPDLYWAMVLCRFGVNYVEDPGTGKRIPTVNRVQPTSIFDDTDYQTALSFADGSQRSIYEESARQINEIQKGILKISEKEDPFDVFICYKESDENGNRTRDSVIATDLYYQLVREGFKVFFARITLEDKLGTAYEPYIFAALNSAKVMVVLGTKPEYFSAVWVKNEWSRYLALVKQSEGKKILIPAYRDMDPYDLPEEFSHLQAQDMSKLGFMQDLIRGIKKMIGADKPVAGSAGAPAASGASEISAYLTRAGIFLGNREWENADAYCEKVLDRDPENPQAYLYKLLSEGRVTTIDDLKNSTVPLENLRSYRTAVKFSDESVAEKLTEMNMSVKERLAREAEERALREKEERERRARQLAREAEIKAFEENRRSELSKAITARDNVADTLSKQVENKNSLQKTLADIENNMNSTSTVVTRYAIALIIVTAVMLIALIITYSVQRSAASAVVGITFILSIIFLVLLLKATGGSMKLVILSIFTLGIAGIVIAIRALSKKNKGTMADKAASLHTALSNIEMQIESSRKSLLTINQKIEALKNEKFEQR